MLDKNGEHVKCTEGRAGAAIIRVGLPASTAAAAEDPL